MDSWTSKYSPLKSVIGLIATAGIIALLLFVSPFDLKPEVQAITHAVLQTVSVANDQLPAIVAGARLAPISSNLAQPSGQPIKLPFREVRDDHIDLVRFVYSINLDDKNLGANQALLLSNTFKPEDRYGLLFIQLIIGGDFYLNDQWVAGMAQSTKAARHIWYEPFIVPLPSRLLKKDGTPNVLTVSQTTHEPYISIPRLYFGTINELSRMSTVVRFLANTLGDASSMLCVVMGLFLLGVRVASPRQSINVLAGSASLLWALMFILFRLPNISTSMQVLWRWALFTCEGGVVCLMTLLIFSFMDQPIGRWKKYAIFGFSGIPSVIYAIGGDVTERYLDLLWTPAAILLYTSATVVLATRFWQARIVSTCHCLLHSGLLAFLATHDYAVQIRIISKLGKSGLEAGWIWLLFEDIYLLQAGLTLFLISASYNLLVKHHGDVKELEDSRFFLHQREAELEQLHSRRDEISLAEATLLERDRIYQDIHDGIGSQLINAIFSLRSTKPDSSAVLHTLQACLQDLRLVIDAKPESNVDLQTMVFDFCVTQEYQLAGSGLGISYNVGTKSTVFANPKVNLNVLRVLQESLSNTLKHSGATSVDINFELTEHRLALTITDNGRGYSNTGIQTLDQQSAYGPSGKRGVTGLARRAADIGATYTIDITEFGTKVRFSIPIPSDFETKA